MFSKDTKNKFWKKVKKTDYCWNWTGGILRGGYGQIHIDKKLHQAHRLSWQLHNGTIPRGMHVLHKCDNPSCIRPIHLFLGTAKDNALDREAKSRGADHKGMKNGRSKLTELQVRKIRQISEEQGITQGELAEIFNISRPVVNFIINKKAWQHV